NPKRPSPSPNAPLQGARKGTIAAWRCPRFRAAGGTAKPAGQSPFSARATTRGSKPPTEAHRPPAIPPPTGKRLTVPGFATPTTAPFVFPFKFRRYTIEHHVSARDRTAAILEPHAIRGRVFG